VHPGSVPSQEVPHPGAPYSGGKPPQALQNLSLKDLRPQFQTEVQLFTQAVCTAAKPAHCWGVRLHRPLSWASLCEAYVAAMSGRAVPHIGGVHLRALQDACAKAGARALRRYEGHLEKFERLYPEIVSRNLLHAMRWGLGLAFSCFSRHTESFPGGGCGPCQGQAAAHRGGEV